MSLYNSEGTRGLKGQFQRKKYGVKLDLLEGWGEWGVHQPGNLHGKGLDLLYNVQCTN